MLFDRLAKRLDDSATTVTTLARAGLLRPFSPRVGARAALAVARDGVSPAAAYEYGAARYPDAIAMADDRGTITFGAAAAAVSLLSDKLERAGLNRTDRVAI